MRINRSRGINTCLTALRSNRRGCSRTGRGCIHTAPARNAPHRPGVHRPALTGACSLRCSRMEPGPALRSRTCERGSFWCDACALQDPEIDLPMGQTKSGSLGAKALAKGLRACHVALIGSGRPGAGCVDQDRVRGAALEALGTVMPARVELRNCSLKLAGAMLHRLPWRLLHGAVSAC